MELILDLFQININFSFTFGRLAKPGVTPEERKKGPVKQELRVCVSNVIKHNMNVTDNVNLRKKQSDTHRVTLQF